MQVLQIFNQSQWFLQQNTELANNTILRLPGMDLDGYRQFNHTPTKPFTKSSKEKLHTSVCRDNRDRIAYCYLSLLR